MARMLATFFLLLLALPGCRGTGATSVNLSSLTITPAGATLVPGSSSSFRATGHNSDGSQVDLTGVATWSSADGSIATVTSGTGVRGVVTAVGVGTTQIGASYQGVAASVPVTVAPVLSITVTPADAVTVAGTTQPFRAVGLFGNGSTQDITNLVTWDTGNSGIGSITTSGLFTPGTAGSTTVSATLGGVSGSSTVSVQTVLSLTVAPASATVPVGGASQFHASATLSGGSERDLTSQVAWLSSDPAVLTVASSGLATGRLPGSALVTAALSGVSGSAPVTVQAPTSLTVLPASASALPGSTRQFSATGLFPNGSSVDLTRLVVWNSTNPLAATVSNSAGSQGLATAVTAGSTTITASLGSVLGAATLTVRNVASLSLVPANPTVAPGATLPLSAIATLSDGSTQEVSADATWNSANVGVVAVGNGLATKGVLTGIATGSATVTASFAGLSATTTVNVTPGGGGGTGGRALVTNFGNGTVSSLDLGTGGAGPPIAVGAAPQGIVFDSGTGRAFVANGNSGTVSVIDTGTATVLSSIPVGSGPWNLALDAGARRLYVTNSLSGTVSVIDTGSNGVVGVIRVGTAPKGVAARPAAGRLYVTNFGDNTLSIAELATNGVVDTVPVGSGPSDVAVDPATGRLFVVNSFDATVSVHDAAGNGSALIPVGNLPQRIVLDPTSGRAYVTNSGNGTVSVLDTTRNLVLATVAVGPGPQGIALRPAGGGVVVVNSGNSTVSVVDAAGRVVNIGVGPNPRDVALLP